MLRISRKLFKVGWDGFYLYHMKGYMTCRVSWIHDALRSSTLIQSLSFLILLKTLIRESTLTLYCISSFFVGFWDSYRVRQAAIVYRLIDAELIRNFFGYPFLFYDRNFGQTYTIVTDMQQRVKLTEIFR